MHHHRHHNNAASSAISSNDDDDYEWPSIFDEANETLLAAVMIYALADLRTLARKGVLLENSSVDRTQQDTAAGLLLVDRILTLPVSTREIVRLVSQNRNVILEHIGESSTDLYLSAFDCIDQTLARLEVCAETGETTLVSSDVVVCDDENSANELVYGIWINSARRRITVTFRGCTTRKDWTMSAHPFLKELHNPVKSSSAGDRSEDVDGSMPNTIAIHYGFYSEW
jgi:hypothetical protein